MAIKRYNTKRGVRCRNTNTNLFVKCDATLGRGSQGKTSLGQVKKITLWKDVYNYKGFKIEKAKRNGELWWYISIGGKEIVREADNLQQVKKLIDQIIAGA